MPVLTLDPTTSALVLIDIQRGIVAMPMAPHTAHDVVARAATLAKRFRERHALVVLVRVDPGRHGELMPHPLADAPRAPHDVPPNWTELMPELGKHDGDVVITKHQPGALYATNLDAQLRRRGIRTIVLGGIATNAGVEATARQALERGYEQLFVEDAMTALEAGLHTHTVTRLFPTIGRVRSTQDVLDALA